jgi:hypothetical protein
MEKRSEWFLWMLPGAMAVGLSVLGNWSPAATRLALLLFIPLCLFLLLWGALLFVLVAVRRWRANRVRPLLAGFLLSVLALFALGDAVESRTGNSIATPEFGSNVQYLWSSRSGHVVRACLVGPSSLATEEATPDHENPTIFVRDLGTGRVLSSTDGRLACAQHGFGLVVSGRNSVSIRRVRSGGALDSIGEALPGEAQRGDWILQGDRLVGAFDDRLVVISTTTGEVHTVPSATRYQLGTRGWRIAFAGSQTLLTVCGENVACLLDPVSLNVRRIGPVATIPGGLAIFPAEDGSGWFSVEGAMLVRYRNSDVLWRALLAVQEIREGSGAESLVIVSGDNAAQAFDGRDGHQTWLGPPRQLPVVSGTGLLYHDRDADRGEWLQLAGLALGADRPMIRPRVGQYYDGACRCVRSLDMLQGTLLLGSGGILDAYRWTP